MVQAVVSLGENEARVINIIKGKFGLKNKSEAINLIIEKYEESFLEPELRPEYEAKLAKITKGKYLSRKEFDKKVKGV
jgi:DNA topoisomerase IA